MDLTTKQETGERLFMPFATPDWRPLTEQAANFTASGKTNCPYPGCGHRVASHNDTGCEWCMCPTMPGDATLSVSGIGLQSELVGTY